MPHMQQTGVARINKSLWLALPDSMNKRLLSGRRECHLNGRLWVDIARWSIVTTIFDGIRAKRVLLHR